MVEINEINQGNCLDHMSHMPDDLIDCIITSPPYDNLRDYEGYDFNFEAIAKELYRVLKPGRILVWVVQDGIKDWSRSGTSFRQALHFMELGFKLVETMFYVKNGTLSTRHNFYMCVTEYMFILSKGKPTVITA